MDNDNAKLVRRGIVRIVLRMCRWEWLVHRLGITWGTCGQNSRAPVA